MILNEQDIENIEQLINTTEIILNNYKKITNLEIKKNIKDIKEITEYLKLLSNIESNYINLIDTLKIPTIIEYLENYQCENKDKLYILKRIVTKLSNIIFYNKYREYIKKKKLSLEEKVEKGKIINIELNDTIDKDIDKIFIKYLNDFINKYTNQQIKEILTDYKYKDIFLNIDNDSFIENYINDSEIYLSFSALNDLLNIPIAIRNIRLSTEINNRLNSHISNIAIKNDIELLNKSNLANVIINTIYVKSCLYYVDENTKQNLIQSIQEKLPKSMATTMLISSIEDAIKNAYQPKIKKVNTNLKIK